MSANVCGAYITSGAFFLVFVAFNTAQVSVVGAKVCELPLSRRRVEFAGATCRPTICSVPPLCAKGGFWRVTGGSQALATTLMETDVANASLAALYGFFTLLCIITPKLVEYIGPK